jgi:hypothetical protein
MACVPVRRGYWGNKIGKVRPLLPAAPAAGADGAGLGLVWAWPSLHHPPPP